MANTALKDQRERSVEVNRLNLIETLKSNKKKHVAEYEEAKKGYRAELLKKIGETFDKAKGSLTRKYDELVRWANDLTDDELAKVNDSLALVHSIYVELKVPRCYAKEYDAAIDMASWDVRETLELTHAEFQCFVRDTWQWSSEFRNTAMSYTKAG